MFKWLDVREARSFGVEIAEFLLARIPPGSPGVPGGTSSKKFVDALGKVHGRAKEFRSRHSLNIYQRARLLHAFQWRLVEGGLDASLARELSQDLLRSL